MARGFSVAKARLTRASSGSTEVDHLIRDPDIMGLNPTDLNVFIL